MFKRNLVQNIKELFFSQRCPICQKISLDDNYICDECYRKLKKNGNLKNVENYYFLYYYDDEIKRLIADFKLKNRRKLSKEIGSLINKPLKKLIIEKNIQMVIPVPISKEREKERGFNQVEEILKECSIEYTMISRKKDTEHMYKLLDNESRKKNIYNAFKSKNLNLKNKNILLVDDIVTTGNTIKEMEKEIRKVSSPQNIYIFSLAISKIFKI